MAIGQGTAIIDFGSHPGANEASVVVTGQAQIGSNSKVDAYVMADETLTAHPTDGHSASDHKYLPLFAAITCGALVAGTGFTIFATSTEKLTGKFAVRFVWAD